MVQILAFLSFLLQQSTSKQARKKTRRLTVLFCCCPSAFLLNKRTACVRRLDPSEAVPVWASPENLNSVAADTPCL
jgi:hypothetical protein